MGILSWTLQVSIYNLTLDFLNVVDKTLVKLSGATVAFNLQTSIFFLNNMLQSYMVHFNQLCHSVHAKPRDFLQRGSR